GLLQRNLGGPADLESLTIDVDSAGAIGFGERETGRVLRFDLILDSAFVANGVDEGALVVLLEAVHGDPIIPVVAGGIGDEADVIGRRLAFVAPLLEKFVQALADERASAVAGLERDEKDVGRAFDVEEVGIAFRWKALFF